MDETASGGSAVSQACEEGENAQPPEAPKPSVNSAAGGKRIEVRRSSAENLSVKIARAFFKAATVLSGNDEDILPQEDGQEEKLSVYRLFAELFPDHVNNKEGVGSGAKGGLTRLQFNKLGYEMYAKEQSRRVPAPRAMWNDVVALQKPGNPGYGFKHARWRSPCFAKDNMEDSTVCQQVLKPFVPDMARLKHIMRRIDDFRIMWDACRRPSHPAGPGRGRKTSSSVIADKKRAYEQVRPLHEARASLAFSFAEGRKSERCTAAQGAGATAGMIVASAGGEGGSMALFCESHQPLASDGERESQRQRRSSSSNEQGSGSGSRGESSNRRASQDVNKSYEVAAKPYPGVLPYPGSHAKTQSFPTSITFDHEFLSSAVHIPLAAGLLLGLREERTRDKRGAPQVQAAALG